MRPYFRIANKKDLPAIAAILTECAQYIRSLGKDNAWPIPYPEDQLETSKDDEGWYIVENEEKKILATFMILWSDLEFWGKQAPVGGYLHKLAVKRAFSHHGLGPQILDWVEEYIRHHGRSYLRLDCDPTNPFIVSYYEAWGFRRVKIVDVVRQGTLRPYLLMEKDVSIRRETG